MRKFYIYHSDSTEYHPLNGEESIWLSDPAGLGITLAPSFANLGGGFFAITESEKEPQQPITFDLSFTGADPYTSYKTLLDWLSASSELYLGYQPTGTTIYKRRIIIKSISKTELTKTRWLTVTVSAVCLAPWSREAALAVRSSAGTGSTSPSWNWSPVPGGQLPAAFRISLKAAAARKITSILNLYAVNNILGGQVVSFPAPVTLAAGETFQMSTAPDDFYIRRVAADGAVTSLVNAVDISVDPLLRLPPDADYSAAGGISNPGGGIDVDAINSADIVQCTMIEYFRGV